MSRPASRSAHHPRRRPTRRASRNGRVKFPNPRRIFALSARWDGPATAAERPIIFSVNKPTGAWDFFNDPLENVELVAKTDSLPAQNNQVHFRKIAKKTEGAWPQEFTGLALIPGDPNSARVVTVALDRWRETS